MSSLFRGAARPQRVSRADAHAPRGLCCQGEVPREFLGRGSRLEFRSGEVGRWALPTGHCGRGEPIGAQTHINGTSFVRAFDSNWNSALIDVDANGHVELAKILTVPEGPSAARPKV